MTCGLKRCTAEPPPHPTQSTKVGLGKEGCSGGSGDNVFLPLVLASTLVSPAMSADWRDKVAPSLLRAAEAGGETEFLVVMSEHANL